MSRILLADDSPHAQRMGERILSEEGFEVVSITDGETALIRLADVDPDVMLVDVFLPGKSGYDLCSYIKSQPRHQHTRVILTAGALEPLDEEDARRAGADGILKKPFEASVVMEIVKPLAEAAEASRVDVPGQPVQAALAGKPGLAAPHRGLAAGPLADLIRRAERGRKPDKQPRTEEPKVEVTPPAPEAASAIDPELVRAAVTLALDHAFPAMVDEITGRVLLALKN